MENKKISDQLPKILLQAFTYVYLDNLGANYAIKIYNNFINRIGSPNKQTEQILLNCLYLFTNSRNKIKLDKLKEQMISEGKTISHNNFATEILSNFPEMVIGFNKDSFAELAVLPQFVNAFENKLDFNTVYENISSTIENDNSPENIQKRKILDNCLKLFSNIIRMEDINLIKHELAESGKEISDINLAMAISSQFPEMVFSTSSKEFCEIVLSYFVHAQIHDTDIKPIYYKRMNRLQGDNSSQGMDRKRILYNCMHFISNSNNQENLGNLIKQMVSTDKDTSYRDISSQIISDFPEIVDEEPQNFFTEIVLLPQLIKAYRNGLDIKKVYDKISNDIPCDNNPENAQKKKILENCLNLFKNDNCLEELNSLISQLNINGRNISYFELAEHVLANFPEAILSTNKKSYAEIVLSSFIQNHTHGESARSIYDKLINRVPIDNNPQNKEKRTILENCLTFFKSTHINSHLDAAKSDCDLQNSDENLAKIILRKNVETILGDNKRTYNMSNRYSNKILMPIAPKYAPVKNPLTIPPLSDNLGNTVNIQLLGELTYATPAVPNESIKKYRIIKTSANNIRDIYEVYSNIDLYKLDCDEKNYDEEYKNAVLTELLSTNNITLSDANYYIGEIHNTINSPQLEVGKEIDDNPELYRYQVSKQYALYYDTQDLSAVVEYGKHQAKEKAKTKNEFVQ